MVRKSNSFENYITSKKYWNKISTPLEFNEIVKTDYQYLHFWVFLSYVQYENIRQINFPMLLYLIYYEKPLIRANPLRNNCILFIGKKKHINRFIFCFTKNFKRNKSNLALSLKDCKFVTSSFKIYIFLYEKIDDNTIHCFRKLLIFELCLNTFAIIKVFS